MSAKGRGQRAVLGSLRTVEEQWQRRSVDALKI